MALAGRRLQSSAEQVPVPPRLSGVTAIAAGYDHNPALKSDGTVVALGTTQHLGEATVPAGLSGVTAVAAGRVHSLALRSDGTVVAWGNNTYGKSTVPGLDFGRWRRRHARAVLWSSPTSAPLRRLCPATCDLRRAIPGEYIYPVCPCGAVLGYPSGLN